MKRILGIIICLAPLTLGAEELKFVTVLSQPVGALAQVEALNPDVPAEANLFVNFCNDEMATSGNITARGLVKMNELRLTKLSRAGSTSPDKMNYQILEEDGFEVNNGGSLRAAKLLAKTANPENITVGARTEVDKASSFVVADIPSMQIGSHTTIVYPDESLTNLGLTWAATDAAYQHNFEVDVDEGVKKIGTKEYNSYIIRTIGRERDCRCGENISTLFGQPQLHCKQQYNIQDCDKLETPSARRVGSVFWRFNYDTCQWYETDPKGLVSSSSWESWQKWGTVPAHHNCQCKGYTSGFYIDSSASSWDQKYGNPRFKSGVINGNMVNEASISRTRLCQNDKALGYGSRFDGTITGSYNFDTCQWDETADCYCSMDRSEAPKKQYSGTSTRTRTCSSVNSKWTGTITDTYSYSTCYWTLGNTSTSCSCANIPDNLEKTESCGVGYVGSRKLKYNTSLSVCGWQEVSNTCEKLVWKNFSSVQDGGKKCTPGANSGSCGNTICSGSCSNEGQTCTYSICADSGYGLTTYTCECAVE